MYQVIPDIQSAVHVEINQLDEVMNQLVRQLTGGFARIRPEMDIAMGVLVAIAIAWFGIMVILERESWAGGFLSLLSTLMWVYFARDFATHANAFVDALVSLGMAFGGSPGADWHKMLSPSHMVSKAFELGKVLLDGLPPFALLGPTDLLGAVLGFILIHIAFLALAANVVMLVCGYYLALAVSGVFVVLGILPYTREWAMKGITAIVGYGVHLMLLAVTATAADSVLRNLHFDQTRTPAMHEIWSMVMVVAIITLFAWIAPQRLASAFMSGSVGAGATDAARPALQTAMLTAGVAGMAASTFDKGIRALDNRPKDSGPRPSQSIQPTQPLTGAAGGGAPSASASAGTANRAIAANVPHPSNAGGTYSPSTANEPILVRPEKTP
jgi:P-type conjugative transfer protein TrbL